MGGERNWLPGTRTGQLAMAQSWFTIFGTNNQGDAWGIPGAVQLQLGSLAQAAAHILEIAMNDATRTKPVNAQCREAFSALIAKMRDIKRRYFLSPPLIDSDYIALGLRPEDKVMTSSGNPIAQVRIETFLIGRHQLGIRIKYVSGDPKHRANKGYRIWYLETAQGEPFPTNPSQLTKSFFTHRLKDIIDFDYDSSGKMVHFAVQIENDGKKGPWGPISSALIP
jgi:hypothetical protein